MPVTTTALDIEDLLEKGIITELAKRTYFATGGAGAGTAMKQSMDNSAERPKKYLVIHAQTAERVNPNYNKWKVPVSLASFTHIPADTNRAICRAFYKECLSYLNTLDKTALSTSSTMTIDGIVTRQGGESVDPANGFQMITADADIYLTKAP